MSEKGPYVESRKDSPLMPAIVPLMGAENGDYSPYVAKYFRKPGLGELKAPSALMRTYRAPGLGTTLGCPTGTMPSLPEAATCVLRYSPCANSGRRAPLQRASVGLKKPGVRETLLMRPFRPAL